MPDCLFCGIVAGDVRSELVASTAHSIAFRDVNPVAPTHVLVIPRRHIENAASVTSLHAEVLADMFELANEVVRLDGLEKGFRLVFNVGEDAGNSVPHLHLHVIGGRKMSWPPG